MKKIIILICVLFCLSGCSKNNENISDALDSQDTNIEIKPEEIYIDNNPVSVSLYLNSYKLTSYNTTLSNFKDIGVFDIYFTNIDKVDGSNTKVNYLKYYNGYENITDVKTGFYITFEADGNTIEQVILDPSSMHSMAPYLYIYLYDDVNQAYGSFYSHLEPEDINDKTVFSSIKLFLAHHGTKITSPITLTVFTYDSADDFTDDNKYRGKSSYTIAIETK